MTRSIDLDGDLWSVREALGETWRWWVDAPPPATGNSVAGAADVAIGTPGWIPARVPGSVIDDLLRAGEIDDPRVGRNSRAAEWVSERSWIYRRTVRLPPAEPGERVVLELDGVDPEASVFWDGIEVGRTVGLYRAARFDLTSAGAALHTGDHVLAMAVHTPPDSQPQVGRTDLVRVHAPRMGYGWDFCPRMGHQGVWKSVRLLIGAVQLRDVRVRCEVDESLRRGVVEVAAVIEGAAEGNAGADAGLGLVAQLSLRGRVAASESAAVADGEARCSGQDDLAVTRSQVGFRSIRWLPNPDGPGDARAYTAVVNGVRIALVGWNWVPADALYGTIRPDRVRHLVDLAARSGARLLRVWGGGLVESDVSGAEATSSTPTGCRWTSRTRPSWPPSPRRCTAWTRGDTGCPRRRQARNSITGSTASARTRPGSTTCTAPGSIRDSRRRTPSTTRARRSHTRSSGWRA